MLLAVVPFIAHPFLSLSVSAFENISAGAFTASLFGTLVLVAVPLLLLGAVSPWATRLKLAAVEESGVVAGRLYALSTIGSLVGVFFVSLWAIEAIGTQRTFLVLAAVPAFVAASALGARFFVVPLALVAALAIPPGTTKPADEGGRVLYETETPYQYARVIEEDDGTRKLELNEGQAIHSLRRPGTVLTGGYWDGFLVLPFATGSGRPPGRIAALGTAGGTVPRAYAQFFPDTRDRRRRHRPGAVRDRAQVLRPATAPAAARVRRGRAAVPAQHRPSATTRSSSTPTASPTSPST